VVVVFLFLYFFGLFKLFDSTVSTLKKMLQLPSDIDRSPFSFLQLRQ